MTLIEVLVAIGVIGVVLAITVPSLRGSRNGAMSLECLQVERGIGQSAAIIGGQNGGHWPNLFDDAMDETYAEFTAGTTTYLVSYYYQTRMWPGALVGPCWSEGDPADGWTCPQVLSRGYGVRYPPEDVRKAPIVGMVLSYYYSPALISDPRLWDPSNPNALHHADDFRRQVGMHDVVYPSMKASHAEAADFHGPAILSADDPEAQSLNTLFCDGHAERVRVADCTSPIPTQHMFDNADPDVDVVPYVGTVWGSRGMDISGGRHH